MPHRKGYITRWFTQLAHSLVVTSGYGPRGNDFHRGIDYGGKGVRGTPIQCPWPGSVTHSGFDSGARGYGNYIGVRMDCGHTMVFAHLDERLAQKGQKISKGDFIGLLGNTGYSTGPHLHFQINRPGTGVKGVGAWGNPDDFIFAPGVYKPGAMIVFTGTPYLRVRKEPGTNADITGRWYPGEGSIILPHDDNGKTVSGYQWWYTLDGWVAGEYTALADGQYIVQPGDMLWKIARDEAATWQQLVEWNKEWYPSLADNPDLIEPGWILWTQPPPELPDNSNQEPPEPPVGEGDIITPSDPPEGNMDEPGEPDGEDELPFVPDPGEPGDEIEPPVTFLDRLIRWWGKIIKLLLGG